MTTELDMQQAYALAVYTDEPCRICGLILTLEDIHAGAVFAGYSNDSKSRTAHKQCWDLANELLEFITVCRSNEYFLKSNRIYCGLGQKFRAVQSSDVIENPKYANEIKYLIDEGRLSAGEQNE